MKFAILVVALAHAVSCGNVGVRTSSVLSPAGVTYVDGSFHAGLAAGPVGYSAGSLGYSGIAAGPVGYSTGSIGYAAAPAAAVATGPVGYSVAAAPAAAVAAAPVATVAAAPVAYAAPVTKYAAVPTVQHVPGVADVPVTKVNAQPAVVQNTVDVARPAVKTQRYEVRRPAIQKQFYDIEERVVVRPAGSALVELAEPLSQTQKGPSVIQPTGPGVAVSSQTAIAPTGPAVSSVSTGQAVVTGSGAVAPPAPPVGAALPSVEIGRSSLAAGQSVSFSGPLFTSNTVGIAAAPVRPAVAVAAPVQTAAISGITSVSAGASGISAVSAGPAFAVSTPAPAIISSPRPAFSHDSISVESADFSFARSSQGIQGQIYGPAAPVPVAAVKAVPAAVAVPAVKAVPAVAAVHSAGSLQSAINHENQRNFIQLLTAKGGVTEIGNGRSGYSAYPVDASVRARVISATPAPAFSAPAGERVNTRRVVVSRPIETLQEVEVAEPVTKFERVQTNEPAVIKSASQGVVRVPTSVPVYGKALAPIHEAPVAVETHYKHFY